MLLLLLARMLIRLVALRWWRSSLGRIDSPAREGEALACWPVAQAVTRAAVRLPGEYVCLPRAMAVQWMLRRRGLASTLVFGIQSGYRSGDIHALHAWVETGGRTIIGDDPTRVYARGLTLVQP